MRRYAGRVKFSGLQGGGIFVTARYTYRAIFLLLRGRCICGPSGEAGRQELDCQQQSLCRVVRETACQPDSGFRWWG